MSKRADCSGQDEEKREAKRIGRNIRVRRVFLKLTQSQLARALKVRQQQVRKYENGDAGLNSKLVRTLCTELDITPNELFGFSQNYGSSGLSMTAIRAACMLENIGRPVLDAVVELANALTELKYNKRQH